MARPLPFPIALLLLLLPPAGLAAPAAALEIQYEVELEDGGPGPTPLWRYTFTLSSASFRAGEGFTVLFHPEECETVFAPSSASPDWDVLALAPDPLLPDFGIFDALALVDSPDTRVSFAVLAAFTGGGTPGSQPFVHYASDFSPLATGTTVPAGVPEPGGLLLFAAVLLGAASIARRT